MFDGADLITAVIALAAGLLLGEIAGRILRTSMTRTGTAAAKPRRWPDRWDPSPSGAERPAASWLRPRSSAERGSTSPPTRSPMSCHGSSARPPSSSSAGPSPPGRRSSSASRPCGPPGSVTATSSGPSASRCWGRRDRARLSADWESIRPSWRCRSRLVGGMPLLALTLLTAWGGRQVASNLSAGQRPAEPTPRRIPALHPGTYGGRGRGPRRHRRDRGLGRLTLAPPTERAARRAVPGRSGSEHPAGLTSSAVRGASPPRWAPSGHLREKSSRFLATFRSRLRLFITRRRVAIRSVGGASVLRHPDPPRTDLCGADVVGGADPGPQIRR